MVFGCFKNGAKMWFWLILVALLFTSKNLRVMAEEDLPDDGFFDEDEFVEYAEDVKVPTSYEGDPQSDGNDIVIDPPIEDKEDSEESAASKIGPSLDAQVSFRFTSKSPELSSRELFADHAVAVAITFWNRGNRPLVVKDIEASLYNASDITELVHNFNPAVLDHSIGAAKKENLDYSFTPLDQFVGAGYLQLVVSTHYEDEDGFPFVHTLFNETMNVVHDDLAFLSDNRFRCLVVALLGVVIFWLAQDYFVNEEQRGTSNDEVQQNTLSQNGSEEVPKNKDDEVDYDWLPDSARSDEWKEAKGRKGRKRRPVKAY